MEAPKRRRLHSKTPPPGTWQLSVCRLSGTELGMVRVCPETTGQDVKLQVRKLLRREELRKKRLRLLLGTKEVENMKTLLELGATQASSLQVLLCPALLALAWPSQRGGNSQIVDVHSGELYCQLSHANIIWHRVRSCHFSLDGSMVAIETSSRGHRLLQTDTGESLYFLRFPAGMLFCMQFGFSPDATFALACYDNGFEDEITKWEVASGRKERLYGVPGKPLSFAFSPDGEFILLSFRRGTFNASELRSSADFQQLRQFEGEIYHTAPEDAQPSSFSKDSKQVVTVCGGNTPKIWETSTGLCLHTLRPLRGTGSFTGFVPGHNALVATFSAQTGTVEMWNSTTGECCFTLPAHWPLFRPPAYFSVGLACSWGGRSLDGTVSACLWRIDSGEVFRTLQLHDIRYVSAYATFSCGGDFIIADDKRGALFRPDGALAQSMDFSSGISQFVRFVPDTTALAEHGDVLVDQLAP